MTDNLEGSTTPQPAPKPEPLQPGTHLRLSVLIYVGINVVYGLPIALWPDLIWDTVAGGDSAELVGLMSARWAGAILLAWAVGGLLVLTRPQGRQTMVTTFALQTSFATVALIVSALADEFVWADTWFVLFAIVAIGAESLYLWYGRWAGREVLSD